LCTPVSTWRQLVVHFSQVPAAAGAFTGSLSAIVLRWWPGLSGGCYSAACDVGYPGEGCISYQIVPLPVSRCRVAVESDLRLVNGGEPLDGKPLMASKLPTLAEP